MAEDHPTLREFLHDFLEERDRRYEERFKALDESRKADIRNVERAVQKAEDAQSTYNIRSNEFRGQLADQANTLMPRAEAEARFKNNEEKQEQMRREIASLRESRSQGTGRDEESITARRRAEWGIGLVVGIVAIVVSVSINLILRLAG